MVSEAELRRIIREEVRDVGQANIVIDPKGKGEKDDVTQNLNAVLRRLLNDEDNIKTAVQANANRVRDAILSSLPERAANGLTKQEVIDAVDAGLRKTLGSLND
jgi:hypothetical protein